MTTYQTCVCCGAKNQTGKYDEFTVCFQCYKSGALAEWLSSQTPLPETIILPETTHLVSNCIATFTTEKANNQLAHLFRDSSVTSIETDQEN